MALAAALARANQPVPFLIAAGGSTGSATFTDSSPEVWALVAESFPKQFGANSDLGQNANAFVYLLGTVHGQPRCELYNIIPQIFPINDEIVQECQTAATLAADAVAPHYRLAQVMIHQEGKSDAAIAEYRKAIQLRPGDPYLRYEFARQLALCGRAEEAVREYDLAHAAGGTESANNSDGAPFHLFAGALLHKQGKPAAAQAEFRRALLLAEDEPSVQWLVASFFHTGAKPDEEIDALRERIRTHPSEIFATSRLGGVFRSLGKLDQEIAVYGEAIGRNPRSPQLHGLLGSALRAQGKRAQAERELTEEISMLRAVLKENAAELTVRERLAEVLIDGGRWNEALEELRQVLAIDPIRNPFSDLGDESYSKGRIERAIALYREAVRLKPTDAYIRNELGYYELELGEVDSALEELGKAVRIGPDGAQFAVRLSWRTSSGGS